MKYGSRPVDECLSLRSKVPAMWPESLRDRCVLSLFIEKPSLAALDRDSAFSLCRDVATYWTDSPPQHTKDLYFIGPPVGMFY